MEYFHRRVSEQILIKAYNQFKNKENRAQSERVFRLTGIKGCEKTKLALNFASKHHSFYFSFAGLDETMAKKLFISRVSTYLKKDSIQSYSEALKLLNQRHPIVILDGMESVPSNAEFWEAFATFFDNEKYNRIFIIMISDVYHSMPLDKLKTVSDHLGWCTIADIFSAKPDISSEDILKLYAISGGIPEIINDYEQTKSFRENIRDLLQPDSSFVKVAPLLLSHYFRRTEIYAHILYAISEGHHRISQIAAFTGFATNKCDKYIKAMMKIGIVSANEVMDKNKKIKTHYDFIGGYLKLWFKMIYINQDLLATGDTENFIDNELIPYIDSVLVNKVYKEACYRFLPNKMSQLDHIYFSQLNKHQFQTKIIKKGSFSYTFDAIIKRQNKLLFVKIFENPKQNCNRAELEKIEKAAIIVSNMYKECIYYDSYVMIFAKRRFSDYAVAQAAKEGIIKLVTPERLKY